jgi:hypothetical protein
LGQTQLNIKIPNVSAKGADKGTFDYAHLRVPLPKDLTGSEIFALKNTASYPESYFLMVCRWKHPRSLVQPTDATGSDGAATAISARLACLRRPSLGP